MRKPKFALALALLALVALASTLSYTGFLVVGVLADQLGIGRVLAGLLLGVLFARVPWLRTVGLLPKLARRPIIMGLLALCLLSFVSRGDYVPALFIGFAAVFLLTFPLIRRAITGRLISSIFKPTVNQHRANSIDGTVIDVEFREKKD